LCKLTNPKHAAAYEYQPNTHQTFFKQLFSVFTKNSLNYSMQDHFTGEGGFCSVMTKHFQEMQKQCSDYGT
jgi:hypothetical protein